ncbi:Uncharacterised protein [Candidatus Burarchaeum australiense]|nr:Uncharacterised protein [Candidatus Burarchaeum australiense]
MISIGLVTLYSTKTKTSKGQFFSLDVIVGSLIFLLAFFIIAFYWLNAQPRLTDQSADLQRDADRIADQIMTPGEILPTKDGGITPTFYPGWGIKYLAYPGTPGYPGQSLPHIDDYGTVPYIHLVRYAETPNTISCLLMWDLVFMSNTAESSRYYSQVKEKLGIPQYEYYIAIEGVDVIPGNAGVGLEDHVLTGCTFYDIPVFPVSLYLYAGRLAPANAREVANAERIVLIDLTPTSGEEAPENTQPQLAKLRVQVWRP